jgi:hypothetical protein
MKVFTVLPCYAPIAFHFPQNSCAPTTVHCRMTTSDPLSFSDALLSHCAADTSSARTGRGATGSEASHSTSIRCHRTSVRRRRHSIRQVRTTNHWGRTRFTSACHDLPVVELDSPGAGLHPQAAELHSPDVASYHFRR